MKRKVVLLLFSFICGALYFAEIRYDFFRLRELEIIPTGALPEMIVWGSVPGSTERFWPSLVLNKRIFVRRIEGFFPVEVKFEVKGWGRCRVSIKPLEPILYVSWRSKMWLLSKNGRMWPADLPSNSTVKGMVFPDKPILAWDSGLAMPIDPERQSGEIYPSSLPMRKIGKWYETIEKIGWKDDIYCVLAKKINGRPVVQLLLGSGDSTASEIIVKEDTSDWLSLASALEHVFSGMNSKVPKGYVVNATLADMKFTVKSRDFKGALIKLPD
jgi:hypothetical protein